MERGRMQYAKDAIRQRVLETAKSEFLEKGFEHASIRTIAAKAQTSKSNLYNYFPDKDALFSAVLASAVDQIQTGLALAKQYNVPKEISAYTLSSQQYVLAAIYRFLTENADDARLLLFRAQGSSLEHYKYAVLDSFAENMVEWTASIHTNRPVSRLFVKTVCSFYFNMIEQLLHSGAQAEADTFMQEISNFIYHGWKSVLSD